MIKNKQNQNEEESTTRVFKTPIVTPLMVLVFILVYVGYSVFHFVGETSLIDGLINISFEVNLLSLLGLMVIYLFNMSLIISYLKKYPAITGQESLDALKKIVRSGMYSSLLAILLMIMAFLTAAMVVLNIGGIHATIVGVLFTVAVIIAGIYIPYEEKLKQITVFDKLLEKELESTLNCWMNKIFPDF